MSWGWVDAGVKFFTPIVVEAATQAAVGAAVGAGIAAVTGKDVGKGALYGAAAGAVTGGVSGALGEGLNLFSTSETGNVNFDAGTGTTGGSADFQAGFEPPASEGPGILSRIGSSDGFGEIAGRTLSGAAQGYLAGEGAKAQADATRDAALLTSEERRKAQERLQGNYRSGSGGILNKQNLADSRSGQNPDERVSPGAERFALQGRWEWDADASKMVQTVTVPVSSFA